jgi:hypothetical protein
MSRSSVLRVILVGSAALLLSGCKWEFADAGCKKESAVTVHVGSDQTCKFRYEGGDDVARYVVMVMQPPRHGKANGEGKYLKYVAKPGFVGEDYLTIRIQRLGRHVQWEMRTITVKVGSTT